MEEMACSLWRQTEAQRSYPGELRMQEHRQPKDGRIKLQNNRPNVKMTECISSWEARQVTILTSLLPNPELGGFDKWLIILRQFPLSDGARGKDPICQCGRYSQEVLMKDVYFFWLFLLRPQSKQNRAALWHCFLMCQWNNQVDVVRDQDTDLFWATFGYKSVKGIKPLKR